MPDIPKDLVPLPDVVAEFAGPPFHLKRSWWDTQITRRRLITYRVPGQRAVYVSRAAVDEVTTIRPNVEIDNEGENGQAM